MTINERVRRTVQRMRYLLNIREDTDYEATVTAIDKSIEFKGSNMWMLAFAIIIASVGLNVNSTAVIIGAMLISPHMGPICGIGLAIGTLDQRMLYRSTRNLLYMVAVSLLSATVYFLISPLNEAQSELLARTRPSIYDVIIALFGGLAGILAQSRKSQAITAISGVAIATALMPPLCTAGYGLASGHLSYFIGALYLFLINSVFIATATVLMVRFLRFPTSQQGESEHRMRVKWQMGIIITIAMVPSLISALGMIRESSFNSSAVRFIESIRQDPLFENNEMVYSDFTYHSDTSEIRITFVGQALDDQRINYLNHQMAFEGIEHTRLIIKQASGMLDREQQFGIVSNLLDKKEQEIAELTKVNEELIEQLNSATGIQENQDQLTREIGVLYADVTRFAIADLSYIQPASQTKVKRLTAIVEVRDSTNREELRKQLTDWLKARYDKTEIELIFQ